MSGKVFGSVAATAVVLLLSACGGGDSTDSLDSLNAEEARKTALAITGQQRAAAARKTAQSDTNACSAVRPFYWEIGASSGRLASGSVNATDSAVTYTASTQVDLGSASKWLYGAYVAQRRAGALTDWDRKLLTMRGGYTNLTECYPSQTVNGCFHYQDNEAYNAAADGKFFYNGGHLQKHAANIGLGILTRQELATEVRSQLGTELAIRYDLAMPAGGATGNAATYALFLRKMMSGQLQMGALLGNDAVCTNPATCPAEAMQTPTPTNENWHYSLAHWVEDDPVTGDGSFSSPGTKGFYPWIDANKTIYGVLSRQVDAGNWSGSVECGRTIRKAWKTGLPQ